MDLKGDTPLHEASGAGHVPVVAALLAGRANPNIANLDTETPLLRAARRGYSGVVEVHCQHHSFSRELVQCALAERS